MAAAKEQLLEMLTFLSPEDLKILKWFLQFTYFHMGLPQIPWGPLVLADQAGIVDQLVKVCGQRCVEVAADILTDMDRVELAFVLSESCSKTKSKRNQTPVTTKSNIAAYVKKTNVICFPSHQKEETSLQFSVKINQKLHVS